MIDPLSMSVMAAILSTAPLVCAMPESQEQDVAQAVKAVEKIIEDYDIALEEAREKYNAAETDEERDAINENFPNSVNDFPRLHEIVEAYPKTEAALKAVGWILSSHFEDGEWAVQVMLNDFIDDEIIEVVPEICWRVNSANVATVKRISNETTCERGKALADWVRANQLITMAKMAQELTEEGSSGDSDMDWLLERVDEELKTKLSASGMAEECRQAGEALFAHCQEAYAEVSFRKGSGPMIGAKAEGALFQARHLKIGDVVPDIAGVDAEGIEFKLSDYRGQVVVLSFWAFWCPPCVAFIPHERSLVDKLADEPFALLGVNADARESYDAQAESMGITWRSFMEGSPLGPIPTTWGITNWPTVFVLDANGVIRYQDVYGETIEEKVMALIEELKEGP